jgi:hypothetical protein
LKRRVAYKIGHAIIAGNSRHNSSTIARAKRMIRRDLRVGRFDAVIIAAGLGWIDLDEWLETHILGPLTRGFEELIRAFNSVAMTAQAVGQGLGSAFKGIKLPIVPLESRAGGS